MPASPPAEARDRVMDARHVPRVRVTYQRAHDRGEIDLERVPEAVLAMPFDLLRHDLLMDLKPLQTRTYPVDRRHPVSAPRPPTQQSQIEKVDPTNLVSECANQLKRRPSPHSVSPTLTGTPPVESTRTRDVRLIYAFGQGPR